MSVGSIFMVSTNLGLKIFGKTVIVANVYYVVGPMMVASERVQTFLFVIIS